MEENKNLEQHSENHVEKIYLSDDMRRLFRKCLDECYEEAQKHIYYGCNKEYVINEIFQKYFDNETLKLELQNTKEQKHQINNDSYTLLDKNASNQVNILTQPIVILKNHVLRRILQEEKIIVYGLLLLTQK